MFSKVLIANRGEIAVRIIRACRELGIATTAVYSEADRDALHTLMADEAVCIGPAPSADSYLNMQNILSVAVLKEVDAIHPGFGFLAENASFARMCRECGITFIGPCAESIELMGNKSSARETMKQAGIPTIPGSEGLVCSEQECLKTADEIGYPLLIKATAGGGGRGIRIVENREQLISSFENARSEAKNYFGSDGVYIEKYIENTRHVEFQIIADSFGNTVHLFDRDCSMQRRNQKLIEESPCASLSSEQRLKMGAAAVNAAKAVGYENAGTVEFLLDADDNFYFIEMNTRVQVEHPVTEAVTGIDIVKEQIKIAAGSKLSFKQSNIKIDWHSIECRINAEDPLRNFSPSFGVVDYLYVPGGFGVRFDSHIYQGYAVPPYYDNMLGKMIVWDKNRENAARKMYCALHELAIEGIVNNIDFQKKIISSEEFMSGKYNTSSINEMLVRK